MLGLFLRKRKILGDAFLAGGNKVVFRLAIPANLFVSLYVAEITDAFDLGFVIFCIYFNVVLKITDYDDKVVLFLMILAIQ